MMKLIAMTIGRTWSVELEKNKETMEQLNEIGEGVCHDCERQRELFKTQEGASM